MCLNKNNLVYRTCIYEWFLLLVRLSMPILLVMLYSFLVSYQVGEPSTEDRSLFFDRLIEAAMSVLMEGVMKKSQHSTSSLSELPKAPKVASGPKASELKAKVEAEQHALRRMRMCLRDVCNRLDINCSNSSITIGSLSNWRLLNFIDFSSFICFWL